MTTKLRPRVHAFAQEYLISRNGTQAALRAGYSEKSAHVTACRLLKNDKVLAFLDEAGARQAERTQINADRILLELGRLAFSDMGKVASWDEHGVTLTASGDLSDDARRSIREITESGAGAKRGLKIKLHDKKGALEMLMRHLKMFGDALGSPENPLQVSIVELARLANDHIDQGSENGLGEGGERPRILPAGHPGG